MRQERESNLTISYTIIGDQHIHGANGKWRRERIDTVNWNNPKYAEIWHLEWEVVKNNVLETAGHAERIDLRSYERQSITDL